MWEVTLSNNNTNRANSICVINTLDDMDKVHEYLNRKQNLHFEKCDVNHIIEDGFGVYSRDKDDYGIYLCLDKIEHIDELCK
jgi:hypothetical protein